MARRLLQSFYTFHMNSQEWKDTKRWYVATFKPRQCAGCQRPWRSGDHLHHQTYEHLAHERDHPEDLVPLCESCHRAVHKLHNKNKPQMTLRKATNIICDGRNRLKDVS